MMKSMTGFGRCEVSEGQCKFTVELKGVNHRYLDVNIRMPKKLNFFDASIRSLLKQYAQRGKVDIFITYEDMSENQVALKYNAAICSEYAARLYGLEILEEKINHNDNNSTRFIIVTNQKIFLKDASKISICFEVSHESGTLYHLLSHFIYNNLSMTKIESRPVEGRTWEYRFFVDFEGNMADGAVKNAIRGLREESKSLKILGNYSSKEGV